MNQAIPWERREDGFYNRGLVQTRLETFVDAAFAFVMTLLVISFNDLPKDSTELLNALKGVPAFAASFALIVQFWIAHNDYCRRYGLDDNASTLLSLLLVFLVLIFVFPLRVQFASLFHWISGGWLASDYRINGPIDLQVTFAVFGASYAAMSACFLLLVRHALRRQQQLRLDAYERAVTAVHWQRWLSNTVVGLLAVALALSYEPTRNMWRTVAGGMVFFLLSLAGPYFAIRVAKLRAQHLGAGAQTA